jgi:hypothetical protein
MGLVSEAWAGVGHEVILFSPGSVGRDGEWVPDQGVALGFADPA